MKVGILVGRENTLPQAFIDRVNSKNVEGITAEMIRLGGTRMGEPIPYRVIVDRISHEIPYYRVYLKKAVAEGVIVINNPFWWSADDKFFEVVLAERLGVAVPRTVLVPNRAYDADIIDESLRNLIDPLPWDEYVAYTGLPAVLKPAIGGGNKNISIVRSVDELKRAWEKSGSLQMILQEFIEHQKYVRSFCLGRKHVLISRYDHSRPHEERYVAGYEGLGDELMERITHDVLTLCRALGYDMNTVEMAIRDDMPYAIDFLNPAPDMDRPSIKPKRFEWVVETLANVVIEFALGEATPASQFGWQSVLTAPREAAVSY
jgi:glutathione synthase/RimK-type ligase-like ATP-grasp enzyme